MKHVYLDHSAATPMRSEAFEAMKPFFSKKFGNPGSFNYLGLQAKNALDNARINVANTLKCLQEEIIFTGSGTESVNLAIKGASRALKEKGNHIICSNIEHHAVLDACKSLEEEGFKLTLLPVKKDGVIDLNGLDKAITPKTILVSVMYANNEIGTIQPIKEAAGIAHSRGAIFHSDACQAACYLDLDIRELGVDLMSLNGSKIYGPKGVGMLFRKKEIMLKPLMHGGGQEFSLRPGTENVPGIIGFAEALSLAQRERIKEHNRLSALRDYFIKSVLKKIPKSILNGHPEKRLPNNANISFIGIEGEALLLYLNEKGICAATGSACTSRSLEPSHVITALGVPFEAVHGSIRFSLGRGTTKKELDFVLSVLPGAVRKLRDISPVKHE